jgi:hypothetical protein
MNATNEMITLVGIVAGIVITISNVFLAYFAYRIKIATMQTQTDVKNVVLHTNSMKDELVKEVREASLAKGAQDQRELEAGGASMAHSAPVAHSAPAKKRPLGRKRT